MSVSVSVGLGTSPPLRAVLVPSILEGTTLLGPLGAPAAAELSNELMAAAPWGTAPSPVPPALAKQPGREGQAPTPPAPVCGQAWPLLLRHSCPGLRGDSDSQGLSSAPFCCFYIKILVPGFGSTRPPFLPPIWPVPSPPLATSIHGHQYLQGSGSPGKDWEGVGCPLCAQSFPGSAITELVPHCALECESLGIASPGTTGSSVCPVSCPLPTPELVSAAGAELSTHWGSVHVCKSQRARPAPISAFLSPRGAWIRPGPATSLAFPSTLRACTFWAAVGELLDSTQSCCFCVLSI
ncbi:hypothetical protein DV515_00014825 [Chloebia gouldiae]|uniref:Uncharacterized protein n=1 Tax=Chloebia gouldiae TaxID=44316 RepID=A0A3L8RYJ4_CHLGU|nr:hypothetical protein DV515_00014825 [Chloebia gouldiae]